MKEANEIPHDMKGSKVVITGMGAICAAGATVSELREQLYNPHPLFHKPQRIELDIDLVVGEVASEQIESLFPAPQVYDSVSSRLAYVAACEAMEDAISGGSGKPTGLIVGTSAAGQSNNEAFVFAHQSGAALPPFDFNTQGVVACAARLLGEQLDIIGPTLTISTACTSSATAIATGAMMIRNGQSDIVLAGGTDELCATTCSGFHSLLLTGDQPSRPFGPNRPGMTLGEGAAFVVLERKDVVLASGRMYYGELCGVGMTADAHHITAPSPNGAGAVAAMKKALETAELEPLQIAWINAHGTGTPLNDQAEAAAIATLFGSSVPVSSNKGLFGHTLGAAGALEAVVCIVALHETRATENFFSYHTADDCPIAIVPEGGIPLPAHGFVLSNSFGFGGNNTSLIFSKGNRPLRINKE